MVIAFHRVVKIVSAHDKPGRGRKNGADADTGEQEKPTVTPSHHKYEDHHRNPRVPTQRESRRGERGKTDHVNEQTHPARQLPSESPRRAGHRDEVEAVRVRMIERGLDPQAAVESISVPDRRAQL